MINKMIDDPFSDGLHAYAQKLRNGQFNISDALDYCLNRINTYDAHLQAFELVTADDAIKNAQALQQLLDSGTDLGPLMGVPVAIKDIIAVAGLPTTNGSLYDSGLPKEAEASIVTQLKAAGCIVVGKTKTVEYALGATGINSARGTPHNPNDWETKRLPGGSSSGSAVAVAAGFAAFALGTDTGGSVRIPACFNGLFGHKTTVGLWPTDGVFPLSPTLDSIGPLCRSAEDAALVHEVLFAESAVLPNPNADTPITTQTDTLRNVRLAIPQEMFFDDLDPIVASVFELVVSKLRDAGADVFEISLPEAHEKDVLFPQLVPPELLHALGREGFAKARDNMDAVTRERAEVGLSVDAIDYVAAKHRHEELASLAERIFNQTDALITPTCPFQPMAIADLEQQQNHQRSLLASRNTQPANLFRLCASNVPVHHLVSELSNNVTHANLPIGLQIMCGSSCDSKLLQLSQRCQQILGQAQLPALPKDPK